MVKTETESQRETGRENVSGGSSEFHESDGIHEEKGRKVRTNQRKSDEMEVRHKGKR